MGRSFIKKIVDIHAKLSICKSTATGEDSIATPVKVPDHQFTVFDPLSEESIRRLATKAPSKSCLLVGLSANS